MFFCKSKDADISTSFNEMRQLPTLPVRCRTGTIGSIGLNFCVRNVNRCDPYDMTTAMAPRTGLEPVTFRLTAERSTCWATEDYALTVQTLVAFFTSSICGSYIVVMYYPSPVEQWQLHITFAIGSNLVNRLYRQSVMIKPSTYLVSLTWILLVLTAATYQPRRLHGVLLYTCV